MIGQLLRQHRKAQKLSQSDLAARSGIHLQTISRIEHHDTSPYWETVARLCEALHVSMDGLWTYAREGQNGLTSHPETVINPSER